jgi:Holliday junction DNA helicase RuvA
MIGRLSGTLVEKQPNQVIVDVGGVGYRVLIPLSTYTALGELNGKVTLLVHTHLREDQLQLYGFLTARERKLFEMLITVSGVGPALALKALSGMDADELSAAIRRGEAGKLVAISGIGKKTAERIVMELRDRFKEPMPEAQPAVPGGDLIAQVTIALSGMGYEQRDIDPALARVIRKSPDRNFEDLFRAALDELTASRGIARRLVREGPG